MEEQCLKLLYDVRHALEAIEAFCAGKTEPNYLADLMLRSAVERQYEIIGEALNRLRKLSPGTAAQISECNRIIGFRNVLAHGYDMVDDRISWDIVKRKLPVLKHEIHGLIGVD
ncbi:MAG: DUF86 domain-containing protein [Roseimicrobium sp.]